MRLIASRNCDFKNRNSATRLIAEKQAIFFTLEVVRHKAADAQKRGEEQPIANEQLRMQHEARIQAETLKARQQWDNHHGCVIIISYII